MKRLTLGILCCALAWPSVSLAQTAVPGKPDPSKKQTAVPAWKNHAYKPDFTEFEWKKLDKPPDLPNMPPWPTGYKLLDSVVAPNGKGGPGYEVVYKSTDTPDKVLQFYSIVLPQYKWSVTSQNKTMISATHGPAMLTVSCVQSTDRKFPCRVIYMYSTITKQ